MSVSRDSRSGHTGRWIAGAVAILITLLILALVTLSANVGRDDSTKIQVTPMVGSRPGPNSLARSESLGPASTADSLPIGAATDGAATDGAAPDAGMPVGTVVYAEGPMRLHSAPDSSGLIMELYPAGESLIVIAPDVGDGTYPIVVDGTHWVRVRDDDGLVGWVPADELSMVK